MLSQSLFLSVLSQAPWVDLVLMSVQVNSITSRQLQAIQFKPDINMRLICSIFKLTHTVHPWDKWIGCFLHKERKIWMYDIFFIYIYKKAQIISKFTEFV